MKHDIAFLHTGQIHVASFTALMTELAPEVNVRHDVKEELLKAAQNDGLTPALASEIEAAMNLASDSGATVVVCTCSTIGSAAEATILESGARSMRIDRAMADQAVRAGPSVLVLAALQSTLAPSRELLESSASNASVALNASYQLIGGAWPHFESGDLDAYASAIANYIQLNSSGFDVVVLAQASMAAAAAHCPEIKLDILSSPRLGVEAALMALESGRPTRPVLI